ncbi:hypothetical protein SAY87_028463 [Trapa incisa]|uniref:Auxin-responsive protein n=1 Tax=Trapa incisa TaxID=236973 RepID=A0AAN7KXW3_9MYRT|nr:hypothetical protein SAY87_028463 [Trapa incisa]
MAGVPGNREACYSFFSFVPGKQSHLSDERELELRLGPPGGEEETIVSSSYLSRMASVGKDTMNDTNNLNSSQNFAVARSALNASTPKGSQKRTAAPIVGWPPIRSSRRNLSGSSSLKQPPTSQDTVSHKFSMEKPADDHGKSLFVKINMDGVPIGRKVDLKACDSYEKLASSVDQLFRGLLAAQRDTSCDGIEIKQEDEKPISGLLDGKGEYTLVYEDNEGDRILVGDVPWDIFVSTVKRLRVLKSEELSAVNSEPIFHRSMLQT